MNLYYIIGSKGQWNHVVLASSGEKAMSIYNHKVKDNAKSFERIKQGKFLVAVTFLYDDVS